jgi:hypothetical protein
LLTEEAQQTGGAVIFHVEVFKIPVIRPDRQAQRPRQRQGMSVLWVSALQVSDRSLQSVTVIFQPVSTDWEKFPLHLDEFDVQPPSHMGQVLAHLFPVKLRDVNYYIEISEDPQRRFSHYG